VSDRDFAEVLRENFEAKNALENAQDEIRKLRERCARLKRQREWLRLNQFIFAAAQPGSKPPASLRSLRTP
jgi:hypothetical protein